MKTLIAAVLFLGLAGCQRQIPFSAKDVKTYHDDTRGVVCYFVVPQSGPVFGLGCVPDKQWK